MAERSGWSMYFINLRRQYLNDRTWFGLALVAAGLGNLGVGVAPWWIGLPVGVSGIALATWGIFGR